MHDSLSLKSLSSSQSMATPPILEAEMLDGNDNSSDPHLLYSLSVM